MTHREARRKLGSRTTRRSNTNGKTMGTTTKGRALKRQFPKPRSGKNALRVERWLRCDQGIHIPVKQKTGITVCSNCQKPIEVANA